MLKIKLLIGLSLVLIASLVNAETFKEGDTVILQKGYPACYALTLDKAVAQYNEIGKWFKEILTKLQAKNQILPPMKFHEKTSHCLFQNKEEEFRFKKYHNNSIAIIENKNYWVAVDTVALKKGKSKPKNENTNYSFIGSDELEAFPSDYIGKRLFLKCKRCNVTELSEAGGYNISPVCMESNGKYGFMGFNPFKIQVVTYDKNLARAIAKSKKQEKWILGTLKKNSIKYSTTKHIFEINEVNYK